MVRQIAVAIREMKSPRKYGSAVAFRAALEGRLKKLSMEEGIDLQRMRRQVAFDRFLCRLFGTVDAPWLLKGGYAMELRVKAARTTRDIDLALRRLPTPAGEWEGHVGIVVEMLREAGRTDLQDFFRFLVGDAVQDLDAAPYGGARFPIDAQLAGRTFVKFHLDVSTGDVVREPFELLHGRDWLGFAGIPRANCSAISPEEQFAEKVHAYTLPREGRENTRVKDLLDLSLLIKGSSLNEARVRDSIRDTFQRRETHAIPGKLPPPPPSWTRPFSEMAAECGLETSVLGHFAAVEAFYRALWNVS